MLNIFISGASGKMGISLIRAFSSHDDTRLIGGCSSQTNSSLGQDLGKLADTDLLGVLLSSNVEEAEKADLIVDFSSIQNSLQVLEYASEKSIPVLVGTTGFGITDLSKITNFSKNIPILLAPNTSLGINLIKKVITFLGKELQNYDINIKEKHHASKKDNPSGTAKDIANTVNQILGKDKISYIDIDSKRQGDIKGEHKLTFKEDYEEIQIIHKVTDRSVFAKGAVEAAIWLSKKEIGLYEMSDVFTFSS